MRSGYRNAALNGATRLALLGLSTSDPTSLRNRPARRACAAAPPRRPWPLPGRGRGVRRILGSKPIQSSLRAPNRRHTERIPQVRRNCIIVVFHPRNQKRCSPEPFDPGTFLCQPDSFRASPPAHSSPFNTARSRVKGFVGSPRDNAERPQGSLKRPQGTPRNGRATPLPFHHEHEGRRGRPAGESSLPVRCD